MAAKGVRRASPDDRPDAVATLVAAFERDPLLRFLAPADDAYPSLARVFFGTLFDLRVDGGGEVRVTDDCSAVSLWSPPGGNRLGAAHVSAVWAECVLSTLDAEGLDRWERFDAGLSAIHPAEPHWYLGVVGVRPGLQGRGLGARVIRAVLDDPTAAGTPAYLVTATEGNVAIYERLGFSVRAEGAIEGGPRLWGMWREAAPQQR